MTDQVVRLSEDETIQYLCKRAIRCRALVEHRSDSDEIAELKRLADLFTAEALRVAARVPEADGKILQ